VLASLVKVSVIVIFTSGVMNKFWYLISKGWGVMQFFLADLLGSVAVALPGSVGAWVCPASGQGHARGSSAGWQLRWISASVEKNRDTRAK